MAMSSVGRNSSHCESAHPKTQHAQAMLSAVSSNSSHSIGLLATGKSADAEVKHAEKTRRTIVLSPTSECAYVRAKYAQLVEKDEPKYVYMLWSSIIARDHVDNAVKDLTTVMNKEAQRDHVVAMAEFYYAAAHADPKCDEKGVEFAEQLLIKIYQQYGMKDEITRVLQDKLKRMKL